SSPDSLPSMNRSRLRVGKILGRQESRTRRKWSKRAADNGTLRSVHARAPAPEPDDGSVRMTQHSGPISHPVFTRRTALQAGSIGLLGLGLAELSALRSVASGDAA